MRAVAIVACLAAMPGLAQAQTLPGLYESTVTMNMPGAPGPNVHTTMRCVTPEEAKDPGESMARSMQRNTQCNMTRKEMNAGHFVADLVCTGEASSTAHMDFMFSDHSAEGTMTMVMKMPQMPQPMSMTMNVRSIRKGACP
jgi:hypothetical protein